MGDNDRLRGGRDGWGVGNMGGCGMDGFGGYGLSGRYGCGEGYVWEAIWG